VIDAAVTDRALRDDISETIQNAWAAVPPPPVGGAPAGGAPAGGAPAGGAPAGGAPIRLTRAQRNFVNNLSLTGPATPLNSQNAEETLTFTPQSTRDQAGLTLRSRVSLTPAGLVRGTAQSEQPWPAASATGTPHAPVVRVEGGAAGFTDFTASLTVLPPAGSITHTQPTATVRVVDERRAWFTANVQHGLIFSEQNTRYLWSPGSAPAYYGGQQSLSVAPRLPSANRGVPVFVQARISRNGVLLQNLPRVEFGETAAQRHLGGVTVLESTPPAAAPDPMELVVEFFPSAAAGAVAFHTLTQPFTISPGGAFTNAQVLAQAQADHAALNATTPGSLLATMIAAGGQHARIAAAIQAGFIKVEPFLLRADSAAYIRANPARGTPATKVAYLMGHTVVDDAHTLVDNPGADAWRWSPFPDSIFLNLTPSLVNPANKRAIPGIMEFVVHESVHVLDARPNATSELERYKGEFRAYWMDGRFNAHSTTFDPTMAGKGPKSPRARKIFEHLYGSPTYDFVLPAYDGNVGGFRDAVDAYLIPDGINLIVSTRLEQLRGWIEGYSGVAFALHQAQVQSLFTGTTADERREIAGNRSWRDLVERKYAAGAERTAIKTDLGIPQ
jgi:hypothetical protein